MSWLVECDESAGALFASALDSDALKRHIEAVEDQDSGMMLRKHSGRSTYLKSVISHPTLKYID